MPTSRRNSPGGSTPEGSEASRVLVVPDIFACSLRVGGGDVWVAGSAIEAGKLGGIRFPELVEVSGLIAPLAFRALDAALGKRAAVQALPYDWRHGIKAASEALGGAINRARAEPYEGRLSIVGHGLGALGAMALLAADRKWADRLNGGRVVLVAPPLKGAESILQLALGKGQLFDMLTRMDRTRSATETLRLFLGMPGVADLLPERALDIDWWDDLALTAPSEEHLEGAAERRDALRSAATSPEVRFVLGAAAETVAYQATEDEELEAETHGDGDGCIRNPVDQLPPDRTWFVAAVHERLIADRAGAQVIADLALTGGTARAKRSSPEELPERTLVAVERPGQENLLAALTSADAKTFSAEPSRLSVRAAHGSLDRQPLPVAVGHYSGDALVGAESFLDDCLGGRLRRRHRMGKYPGAVGSALVLSAPDCSPPGALVIGLGEVGELTAGRLFVGIEAAALQLALQAIERRRDESDEAGEPESLSFASLLIGTRGGRQLSVRQSIVATVRGVFAAKRLLAREKLDRQVTIDEIVFVDLWADVATAAGHVLEDLAEDSSLGLLPNETVEADSTLKILEGGRTNRGFSDERWSWWRRLIVSEPNPAKDGSQELRFVSLSERARAEDRTISSHRSLVDELLQKAPKSIDDVAPGSVVNALFELLLPVALKESVFDGAELVLVLDRQASRYPWELLARRKAGEIEPLISRVRLLRQFRTVDFRDVILPARTNNALVIGEPKVPDVDELTAAKEEGKLVAAELQGGGFDVEQSIGEDGNRILQKFFLFDYRIMHIAAHGIYDAKSPEESGVIIGIDEKGRRRTLSAAVFRQLRAIPEVVFLNCCHLGKIDQYEADRVHLAASVSEALIGLGVRCVVAAGWAVNDKAGLTFAQVFYRELLQGRQFGEAVHAARGAVWERHSHTTTWGAYQCYGDPAFKLAQPAESTQPGKPAIYVSKAELQDRIADIAAKATNTGRSADDLSDVRGRLRAVEDTFAEHPRWREGGEILFALAEAWKQASEPEKAIDLYRAALRSADGHAPIRAAEQLANLLDRYGSGRVKDEELAALERGASSLPEAWLEWADRVGRASERASLLGGLFKRRAMSLYGVARKNLLVRSAEQYRKAVQLKHEECLREARIAADERASAEPEIHYYSGLNAVAVAWASRDQGLLADAAEWIEKSRASAAKEQEREGGTLRNRLAACEADLLEALLQKKLTKGRARAVAKKYKSVLVGSEHERDSARKQIDFLVAAVSSREKELVESLRIIQEAFSQPEE